MKKSFEGFEIEIKIPEEVLSSITEAKLQVLEQDIASVINNIYNNLVIRNDEEVSPLYQDGCKENISCEHIEKIVALVRARQKPIII